MGSWSRPDVHVTCESGDFCLWTWDGRRASRGPLNSLYNDLRANGLTSRFGRIGQVDVQLPGAGRIPVPCLRWPVAAAVQGLGGRPASPHWSASLAWLHSVVELGSVAAGSGRLTAAVVADRPVWRLVRDGALEAAIERLRATMPPVVAAAGPVDVAAQVERAADATARMALRSLRWKPPVEAASRAGPKTVKAVFRALADDPTAPASGLDRVDVVREVGRIFEGERARLLGEPLVLARLRMTPPVEADAPWRFALEVVDATDRGRWCTAADVWGQTPLAVDVAGDSRHLAVLARVVDEAAAAVVARLPALAPLATAVDGHLAGEAELDVVAVSAVLEQAAILDELGIELLGPEELVRANARVVGAAAPAPPGGPSAGLGLTALVSWNAQIGGVEVDAAELARADAAGAALMQVGGRWVRLDRTQVRRALTTLQRNRAQFAEVDPATLLRLAAELADLAEHAEVEEHSPDGGTGPAGPAIEGAGWTAELLSGLPDDHLVESCEPDGFRGELRHYQRRALSWLAFLRRLGLGGCLADDMGLGKTATTLAHVLGSPGPHLVVCPLSVVRNWEQESARFTPSLRVVVHHGGERARGDEAPDELAKADVVVTTYGLLTREIETLAAVNWSVVVFDEAQAAKNPNTKVAKALRHLHARQRVALTGTPVENRLSELWAILDAANPGLLGSLPRFQQRYATPIEKHHDEAVAARLRTLTQPFLLRRTKADRSLVPDLPDKVEQIAWATLTKEQAALYQAVVDQLLIEAEREQGMRRRGLVLASLTRLKQICNHPAHALGDGSRLAGRSGKLARFDELTGELVNAGERALVFTQYRAMGELLVRHVAESTGRIVPFLHGGVPRRQRDGMVERFQDGQGQPLLVVSLKAGGTGLNLTAASRVIHYDRWWNPAVEDQATDRAWRIGQTHTVFVHKLVCSGTLEERIDQLIDGKRALASSVVGVTGEAWLSELSTDELRELVALDGASAEVAAGSRGSP
jgi:superfamily II DNA or RNA helicase